MEYAAQFTGTDTTMDLQKAVWISFVLWSASLASAAVSGAWWSDLAPRAFCSTPGEVRCSRDCSQVQLCMGSPDGEYNPETMITCHPESGTKCSAVNKTCVPADESECHSTGTFKCNGVGSYPDPYDCQKFHVCLEDGGDAQTGSCRGDAAYNPLTADCSLTTSDRVCTEGPVERCTEPLDVGVVPENPSIYYVCKPSGSGYDPEMYRCPAGRVFDEKLFACENSSANPEPTQPTSPPVTAPPSHSPPVTPTQAPPVTPSPGGKCSTPGEFVADPQDCYRYYACIGSVWMQIACSDGYHYDAQVGLCIEGLCPTR